MALLEDLARINDLLGTHVTLFEQLAQAQERITSSSLVLLDAEGRVREGLTRTVTTDEDVNRGVITTSENANRGVLTSSQSAEETRQLVQAIDGVRRAVERMGGGAGGGGGAFERASGLLGGG